MRRKIFIVTTVNFQSTVARDLEPQRNLSRLHKWHLVGEFLCAIVCYSAVLILFFLHTLSRICIFLCASEKWIEVICIHDIFDLKGELFSAISLLDVQSQYIQEYNSVKYSLRLYVYVNVILYLSDIIVS